MLIPIQQWRIHRFPIKTFILNSFSSLIFTKTSASAAAAKIEDDEPTSLSPPNDTVLEILSGLKTFGSGKFFREHRFKSLVLTLTSPQIDRIVDHLRIENPNSAVEFFDLLKNEYGFRHSRVSVFLIAHLLAGKRRLRSLRSLIQQMLQREGNDLNKKNRKYVGFENFGN